MIGHNNKRKQNLCESNKLHQQKHDFEISQNVEMKQNL